MSPFQQFHQTTELNDAWWTLDRPSLRGVDRETFAQGCADDSMPAVSSVVGGVRSVVDGFLQSVVSLEHGRTDVSFVWAFRSNIAVRREGRGRVCDEAQVYHLLFRVQV